MFVFLFSRRAMCGRNLSYQLNVLKSPLYSARSVGIKIVQEPGLDKLSYEEKNEKLKREMSPHLTIYRPQLTSMLSITHRFTGMNNY